MHAKGKIAVIMPVIVDTLDSDLLKGIEIQGKMLGYDILVFTNAVNHMPHFLENAYADGEENIYRLIQKAELDGVLFAAGRFHDSAVIEKITKLLKQVKCPCLVMENQHSSFPFIYMPQRDGIRQLTEHLITEHGCRRLFCLTGYKGMYESEERLQGFCEALVNHGLPVRQEDIFYGDFWKESAKLLGERIASGEVDFPNAVVCASDTMAAALCEALKQHGIRVPDQIAVTGFDGSEIGEVNVPSITTVCGKDILLGRIAVRRLHEMITGIHDTSPLENTMSLKFAESCGCMKKTDDTAAHQNENEQLVRKILDYHQYREYYMTSNFIVEMSEADSLMDYIFTVDRLAGVLEEWEHIDLCLCEDWLGDLRHPERYRTEGYSDRMLLILSKGRHENEPFNYLFPSEQLLPSLNSEHEPRFIVFTPLHCRKQVLGYCAVTYPHEHEFMMTKHFLTWCDAASNGLRVLRNKLYTDYMKERVERYSVRDPLTGMFNKKGLLKQAPEYLNETDTEKENNVVALISWQNDGSGNLTDDCMMMANAVQLICMTGALAARIGERIFMIIHRIPECEDTASYLDEWLLHLYRTIQSIQKKYSNTHSLELHTEYCQLEAEVDFSQFCEDRLSEMINSVLNAGHKAANYSAQLSSLRLRIRLHPEDRWNAEDIAEELNLSRSHFQRLYKQMFGAAFKEDVILIRMNKAKKLLKSTSLTVQEIAEQCGYQDTFHFMRQFKAKVGMTAAKFRDDSGQC